MVSLFPGRSVSISHQCVEKVFFGSADTTLRLGSFDITVSIWVEDEGDYDCCGYMVRVKSLSRISVSGDLTVKVAHRDSEGAVTWRSDVCSLGQVVTLGIIPEEVRHFFLSEDLQDLGFFFDGSVNFIVDLSSLQCEDCDQHFGCDWNEMWADMLFPDMHLITSDGDEISCHRAVLCCASSVFKAMLTGSFKEASHAEITIPDTTHADIKAFLEYVYTRELSGALDHGALGRILRIADMYDIADLAEICACRLVAQTDKSNVVEAVGALFPYHQSDGKLAKWAAFLLTLLECDRELLVPLLYKVAQTPSFNNDLQDSASAAILTQPMAYSSFGLHETLEAATVDTEKHALPLLNPDSHEIVEMKVLQFPLPPPGLDLRSPVPEVSPCKVFGKSSISVLCFNSCTRDFSDTLRKSELAQKMLSRGAEVEPSWANGAKVFVERLRPEMVEPVIKVDSLRPWHVIVHTENEEDVMKSIKLAWVSSCFASKCPRVRQNVTKRLTVKGEAKSSCPQPEVVVDKACEEPSMLYESDPPHVSFDAAGTVHFPIPPSLSPRSLLTAPP